MLGIKRISNVSLFQRLLQGRPEVCVSDGKNLRRFNRTFAAKQESSLGSDDKISLHFVKSMSLYIGLPAGKRWNLDFLFQGSALPTVFSCHDLTLFSAVMILAAF